MSPVSYPFTNKRVLATVVDYTIVFAFFFWFVFTFGTPNEEGEMEVSGMPALIPVGFWFCFLILPEGLFGQTLGHALAGIKVFSLDGTSLRVWQVIKRRLADAVEISWCFGLLAFTLVKNTNRHQRLGDIWANTVVLTKDDSIQFDFDIGNDE